MAMYYHTTVGVGHFDYMLYNWSDASATNTPGDWYCAHVYENANTSGPAKELMQRLGETCEAIAGVRVVPGGVILEIKWPSNKEHNLRSNSITSLANSNMTVERALNAIKMFDRKFGEALVTPNAWAPRE